MSLLTEHRRVDLTRADGRRLLDLLRHHDLRGHGGAAFPTATKISSAIGCAPRLIINACDGEPLVTKDAELVARVPGLVLDGAALVAHAVQARDVLFAVHAGSATETRLRSVLLAEQGRLPGVRVLSAPPRYVSSESSALAALAAGGEARPVIRGAPLTAEGPGRGRIPVLVLNAETAARCAQLWLDAGVSAPSTRLVTMSGAVRRPGVVETGLDVNIAELVHRAGGVTSPPRAVLLGGYGGSWVEWPAAADLALAPAALAAAGADLGPGLIHVHGADCPLASVAEIVGYLAAESAGQCGPCMFGLPAIAADVRELGDPRRGPAAWERLRRRLPVIEGRGACRHPDGAVRQTASALRVFAAHIQGHWSGQCDGSSEWARRVA